jgi:hypothetical protein
MPALQAQAYTAEVPPWSVCLAEKESNETVEEYAKLLSPPDGATVPAGTSVTFLARSGVASPMSFMVASSPASLSSPDIDGGLGSRLQPEYTAEYTLTSTKAVATPRTIYWTASFTRTLRDCEGPPVTFTLPARTLTVLPSPPAVISPPLQLSISDPGNFQLTRPTVTYRIHCTASCSGKTYFQAWLVRRHRRTVRAPELDFGPASVSVAAASGGSEQFTHRYNGGILRRLKSILHEGDIVELRLSAEAANATGNIARAHSTARLHV